MLRPQDDDRIEPEARGGVPRTSAADAIRDVHVEAEAGDDVSTPSASDAICDVHVEGADGEGGLRPPAGEAGTLRELLGAEEVATGGVG